MLKRFCWLFFFGFLPLCSPSLNQNICSGHNSYWLTACRMVEVNNFTKNHNTLDWVLISIAAWFYCAVDDAKMIKVSAIGKGKGVFFILYPTPLGLGDSLNCMQSVLPSNIALMYVAACLASGVVSVHLIPRQASPRQSMARYATSTATEIPPQGDSNPMVTSTSQ